MTVKDKKNLKIKWRNIILFALCSAHILIGPGFAKTYFIDPSIGDDDYSGETKEMPWDSLKNISEHSFIPGDSILLKRGWGWNESVVFSSSGSSEAPIIIGAYGEGEKPIIQSFFSVESWASFSNDHIWRKLILSHCYGVFEDGGKKKQASSSSLTDGSWFFSKPILYFRPSEINPQALNVTFAYKYANLKLNNAHHVIIKEIAFEFGTIGVAVEEGSSHITIENCRFNNFYEQGIGINGADGNCRIIDNEITNVGDGIYLIRQPGDNHTISGNTVSYCNFGEYNNNDGHAIGVQNSSNNIIEKNDIDHCKDAIAIWAKAGDESNHNRVLYNKIFDCNKSFQKDYVGKAIAIGSEDKNGAQDNYIAFNIVNNCNFGIKVSVTTKKNYIFNNLIAQCGSGLLVSRGADQSFFFNNILFNIDNALVVNEHLRNGENNYFDYNNYYPVTNNNYFVFKGKMVRSFVEWVENSSQDSHSTIIDPKVTCDNLEAIELGEDSICKTTGMGVGEQASILGAQSISILKESIGPF